MTAFFVGCVPTEQPVVTPEDGESDDAFLPDLPTGGCGAPAYDWVDPTQLGEIVAHRELPLLDLNDDQIDALALIAGIRVDSPLSWGAKAWQVRYLTQDRGEVVEATALIALPKGMAPGQRVSTILYNHPTAGFEDFCAPSGLDLIWSGLPVFLASRGFAVVAPDLLGLAGFGEAAGEYHPHLVAEATAVASLDAVRALWRFADSELSEPIDVEPSTRTALVGNSEGGFSALWNERYAPHYLPEAQLLGVTAGVPPLDLVDMVASSTQELSVATAGMPLTLRSMESWYRSGTDLMEQVAPHSHDLVMEYMDDICPDVELPEEVASIEDVWTDTFREAVAADDWEPWSCFSEQNSLPRSTIPRLRDTPMLMVVSSQDDVSLTEVQRKSFETLCDQGYRIVWKECADTGHRDTVTATLADQALWIADRMAGVPLDPADVCVMTPATDCD